MFEKFKVHISFSFFPSVTTLCHKRERKEQVFQPFTTHGCFQDMVPTQAALHLPVTHEAIHQTASMREIRTEF
jgi:hypothetical protein